MRSLDIAVNRMQSPAVGSLQSVHCRHKFGNCWQSGIELFAKGMKSVGWAENRRQAAQADWCSSAPPALLDHSVRSRLGTTRQERDNDQTRDDTPDLSSAAD
jgi:hypothetical protein